LVSEEKMSLTLDKYSYKPGEIIKGNIKINLEKPLKGRKLQVALIGAVITTSKIDSCNHFDDHLHHHKEDDTFTVPEPFYNFTINLDGEKEYIDNEYAFEIKIPSDAIEKQPRFEGWLKKAMDFSRLLGGHPPYVEWFVYSQLDVPWKIDIWKKQKIEIL